MIKAFLRTLSLVLFVLLLTYAPEILTAVSSPYQQETKARVLLRIALSSPDEKTVASLYKALNAYQKAYPSVHLRVNRVDEQQILSLSEPLPDVYLFSEAADGFSQAPLGAYQPEEGSALLCSLNPQALQAQAARQFVDYLLSASSASHSDF